MAERPKIFVETTDERIQTISAANLKKNGITETGKAYNQLGLAFLILRAALGGKTLYYAPDLNDPGRFLFVISQPNQDQSQQ